MSTNTVLNRQIDAFNRHDAQAFAACYSSDAIVFDPQYPELLKGRDAVLKDVADFFAAFPDLRSEVKREVRDGDTYAYEISMTGTHKGPMVGPSGHIPATNRRVTVGGGIIARLDSEGRIVEERRYYDLAGMLSRLGLMQ